jgi:TolB-like protein
MTTAAQPRRTRTIAVAALGIVLVIVLGAYSFARNGFSRTSTSATTGASTPAGIRSIAVLPLDNYSGDSTQEYFAEGMTDELTAALATISQLRVTSRGSAMQFQGKSRPPTPQIAKTLDVDAVVEGSVSRSGDKVRITALSPAFAPAYSGLSDAYLWAGYNEGFTTASAARPKAKAAAEKAVQLDSNSAEGHTSLAVFKLFYERDWRGCEREFRRAIALNPNYGVRARSVRDGAGVHGKIR